MNAGQLWNDHTFRVLLDDLFKARKDEALGPLRLEAIFRYVEGTQQVPDGRVGRTQPPKPENFESKAPLAAESMERGASATAATVEQFRHAEAEAAGFELSEAEESQGKQSASQYLEQQLQERKKRDPNESLKKAADIVQKALESSGDSVLNVRVPRNYVVAGLEAILKERRVAFSSLSCAIQPKQVHLDTKSAAALSGAAGESNGGWTITVQR